MHPISEVLFQLYENLLARKEIYFELGDENRHKIDSIVKTVNGAFFGFERFRNEEDKVAAYFVLMIKDHPFTDGNKRMAVLWLKTYTEAFELVLKLPKTLSLDELAVGVLNTPNSNTDEIIPIVKYILFADKNEELKNTNE